MKKAIGITLLMLLILTFCVPVLYASENEFTEEEATNITELALNLYDDYFYGCHDYSSTDKQIDAVHGAVYDESYFSVDVSDKIDSDNDFGSRIMSYVFKSTVYNLDTYADFAILVKSIYSNNSISEFVSENKEMIDRYKDKSVINHNEKAYFKDTGLSATNWPPKFFKLTNLKVSNDRATANVIMVRYLPVGNYYYFSYSVSFVKEDDVWKYDSCITDLLSNSENCLIDNPSTSSPTPIYLALAGAALVGVCLPVVKRKRRKAD